MFKKFFACLLIITILTININYSYKSNAEIITLTLCATVGLTVVAALCIYQSLKIIGVNIDENYDSIDKCVYDFYTNLTDADKNIFKVGFLDTVSGGSFSLNKNVLDIYKKYFDVLKFDENVVNNQTRYINTVGGGLIVNDIYFKYYVAYKIKYNDLDCLRYFFFKTIPDVQIDNSFFKIGIYAENGVQIYEKITGINNSILDDSVYSHGTYSSRNFYLSDFHESNFAIKGLDKSGLDFTLKDSNYKVTAKDATGEFYYKQMLEQIEKNKTPEKEGVITLPAPATLENIKSATAVLEQAGVIANTNTDTNTNNINSIDFSTPTKNIDLSGFKSVGAKLSGVFPFCIPWDIKNFFESLNVSPVVPVFKINFDEKFFPGGGEIVFDLSKFDDLAKIVRWGIFLLFSFGLALKTRDIIKG